MIRFFLSSLGWFLAWGKHVSQSVGTKLLDHKKDHANTVGDKQVRHFGVEIMIFWGDIWYFAEVRKHDMWHFAQDLN